MNGGVSVIIPAYNEAATIEHTVASVWDALHAVMSDEACELIVVDDASRDGTAAELKRLQHAYPLVPVLRATNGGYAAAVTSGLAIARGSRVVVYDADMSYGPGVIGRLLDALGDGHAAVALASPYMRGGCVSNVPPTRAALSRYANVLLERVSPVPIATYTGMVRAYRTPVLMRLIGDGVPGEFNVTVLARALRSGERVVEIPAHLAWPEHRRLAVRRMSMWRLAKRIAAVLRSAAALAGWRTFAGAR